jgi:hypothetical protein
MISIPPTRRPTDQRWVVLLWRNPPQAHFNLYREGRIDVEHIAEWSPEGWLRPIPSTIPATLAARAHRHLRQLQRTPEANTTGDRLARARRYRRQRAATTTSRLLKP